ncbi:hypothetical protein Smic_42200 [Streptomyces microflavus]|uniref:Fluoride-specific ion channel FluC n=1 Tax=Streptomyces microflavus TaxID=1919 RepID=A0A7J0CUP5_STRMI|nr:hypothetical protein Smic_42200 [Streptomyces microflavus]
MTYVTGACGVNWLLVVIGGAVGAPLRYLTDRAVQAHQGPGVAYVFPWGTFTANAAGSLLLGILTGAAVSSPVHALLATGLCGALTTYSTFSYETLRLAETGRGFLAAANVVASLLTGLGAVFLGRSWRAGSGVGRVRGGGRRFGRVSGGVRGVGHGTTPPRTACSVRKAPYGSFRSPPRPPRPGGATRAPLVRPCPLGSRHRADDRRVHRLYERRRRRRQAGALALLRPEGPGRRAERGDGLRIRRGRARGRRRPPPLGLRPEEPGGQAEPGGVRRCAVGHTEGPAPRTRRPAALAPRPSAGPDAVDAGAGGAAAGRAGTADSAAHPDPGPDPEPEPTEPSEPPPSASPAAQLRTQAMGGAEEGRPLRTPEASPQVGPV